MSWFFNMCDSNMHGERIKIVAVTVYCYQKHLLLMHWNVGNSTPKRTNISKCYTAEFIL
jgi:hypothetical protein